MTWTEVYYWNYRLNPEDLEKALIALFGKQDFGITVSGWTQSPSRS